jgi:putative PEP-CTERM system histidine kinase
LGFREPKMINTLYTIALELVVVSYGTVGTLLVLRGAKTWLVGFLFVAMAATALWAQSTAAAINGFGPDWLVDASNPIRDAAWLALGLALIYPRGGRTIQWRALLAIIAALMTIQLAFDASHSNLGTVAGVRIDSAFVRVVATFVGLVLIENIFRNSSPSEFWSLKHLVIGLGCVLVFQLATTLPEFLTHIEDADSEVARPLVFLLVLPLFVVSSVRIPNLKIRIHSSRAFVFYSATFIGVGIMLQGVAVAAWYVRQYGGSTGTILAVILLFGGVVAVASALVSGSIRSRIRRFINENFFSLKYDYRLEWERVIRALSLNPEQESAERVLRTLCDLLDCPGGALWIYRSSWRQFIPVATLGFASELGPFAQSDPRIERLRQSDRSFLSLQSDRSDAEAAAWRATFEQAWLIVPLRYRSLIVGIAVISKPRVLKKLDWEDENLIRIIAMQLGAFVVQEETAQSLADARQLEEFNKRFAYVVHDIKNLIGQMSLLVQNAKQFGHDPEFRQDMVLTLGNSVERLQQLLKSLTTVGSENVPGSRVKETIDLIEFLSQFTKEKVNLGHKVVLRPNCQAIRLEMSDVDSLRRVLDHVVANATEASPPEGLVEIDVQHGEGSIEIVVSDRGAGMTEKFINEELFRPMRTTKSGGFGIGAYQARELMRDLGGDLTVASSVGKGTAFTLLLPKSSNQERRFS